MESTIIITNQENKLKILKKLSTIPHLYNLKFYTFSELKRKLYFDYDIRTLDYVANKYQIDIDIAQNYLENMYFLKDIGEEKTTFLLNLKEELESQNLLIKTPLFSQFIHNKKIIVYNNPHLNQEQKLILKGLNFEHYLLPSHNYQPPVYIAATLEEEVNFVFEQIAKLLTQEISPDQIKIIITSEYSNIIQRYSLTYNIPLNLPSKSSYYSTVIAQEFLANYDEYDLETNISILQEKYSDLTDLITIINKSSLIQDKAHRKSFIIRDLKHHIISPKYTNAIEVGSITTNYDDSTYVFLLGFNVNNYPHAFKDEDYLNDEIKAQLELDTSYTKNLLNRHQITSFIQNTPNLTITSKLSDNKTKYYPSILIKELNLEAQKITLDEKVSYSRLNSYLKYGIANNNLKKYNTKSPNYDLYQNTFGPLEEYDNSFTGLSNQEVIKDKLNLSYTSMQMYYECSFKYYISKILKLDIYEETFKTIVGDIFHHILEIGLTKDIDIPSEIIQYIKEKEYEPTKKEYFYLEKLSAELKLDLNLIKEQEQKSRLQNHLMETEFYVSKEVSNKLITITGLVDKINYLTISNKRYVELIDYKTGQAKINLENLKYGLNMQLPLYIYLLNLSPNFQDAIFAGFFIQKVLSDVPKIDLKKSLLDIKKADLKLDGYASNNPQILELLDEDYQNSTIIRGLKFKKNNEPYKTSKLLSPEEIHEIIQKVDKKIDECVTNILTANFAINPKLLKGKNISCEYCHFKDLCYKKSSDIEILGGEEDELE